MKNLDLILALATTGTRSNSDQYDAAQAAQRMADEINAHVGLGAVDPGALDGRQLLNLAQWLADTAESDRAAQEEAVMEVQGWGAWGSREAWLNRWK